MPSLKGKRVLVVAGSRGLGAEIVKQAAERGAIVAINYAASKDRAEELCKSLQGSGHFVIQGDAFTHDGCDSIVAEAIKGLGGLDAVVSNQGATKFASWADLKSVSDEDWMKIYNANVMSHLWVIQAAEKELRANKGSFLISASVAGLYTNGSSMAYSVSKAGLIHLSKGLAKSLAPDVRVNAIAPGLMLTEWADGFSEAQVKMSTDAALLKKVSDVPDVAAAYIMLMENGSITGEILEISAGLGH
ncbi:hypothetical protein CcaverHIS002_0109000 [Cutaneotrichosporon cavernicola]|uniref:Uncharacterized protein n=1 Tax=Cutaneotrichosporon cavernicola TaxID=279322 RepID=A0AA48L0G1_9TREE|nr:uncharacterized protein CcaverHIS019_0108930 [Cutaneotrichosporon cavernicola]BEI80371.1 hypothetical protein CcaverHIS002_0109000 [Cutaneotrichosporon cavernicola]BEI88175.1 hypothetical protein CcaverHIS019_0108930 [Cutaneotrichosporon cavernicola]BEI95946.1 hypothetical protein CcaverHIS631_0108950 [Cutaneotrichosporon cavernicola]BEJ03721.1 hypothetical protein CcaverHIS641_0108960 [Cutaneotrichosporon cavernicola]